MPEKLVITGDLKVDAALESAITRLDKKRRIAWAIIIVSPFAALIPLSFLVALVGGGHLEVFLFISIGWIMLVKGVSRQLNTAYSKEIIPTIASQLDLEYKPKFPDAHALIDIGLLPRGLVQISEDWIRGKIGDRQYQTADLRIAKAGSRRRQPVLFRGMVVSLRNPEPLPELAVVSFEAPPTVDPNAPMAATAQSAKGKEFHLCLPTVASSPDPSLRAFFDKSLALDGRMKGFRLFSIVRTEAETHVALSRDFDSFYISGLFTRRESLQQAILDILEETKIPLEVVQTVLEAEQAERQGMG